MAQGNFAATNRRVRQQVQGGQKDQQVGRQSTNTTSTGQYNRTPKNQQGVTGGGQQRQRNNNNNNNNNNNRYPPMRKWLAADEPFQGAKAENQLAFDQYLTDAKQLIGHRNRRGNFVPGRIQNDFATALERMKEQRREDLGDVRGDFASRGLGTSALNFNAQGDLRNEYLDDMSDLRTNRRQSVEDVRSGIQDQRQLRQVSLRELIAQAARRRAERYNIPLESEEYS